MAVVTKGTSGVEIEIDERGRARMFVDGVLLPSYGIDFSFSGRDRGDVVIRMSATFVTFKNVTSHKTQPSGELI